ncbi:MAG TPA: competence/damage-inducible protein A [bacterium]|nr:competence/damage-inducible protein A [bacterium]
MHAEIISIGDELISGKTINSNAAWMGRQLLLIGVPVLQVTTVGDDAAMIREALATAERRSEIILITGGLGPTHDDITRSALCQYFQCDLVLNPVVLEQIRERFRHRGLPLAKSNESQAMVPSAAQVIYNRQGTAPGYHFEQSGRHVYVLPGVPHEMQGMMNESILPEIRARQTEWFIESKTFCTNGIAESMLYEKIGNPAEVERWAKMAFLPAPSGVQVRLIAQGTSAAEARQKLEQAAARVLERAGRYIYADYECTLEQVVAELLTQRKATVATAESCTGGLIAHKLTSIAGSSAYFERGVVCYSNRAKTELLHVPTSLIERHGAVSEQVAMSMAENVRRIAGVDYGIATTGIAGPGGGSDDKPVGLVFIGVADKSGSQWERHIFSGERWLNKERFANSALNLLRKRIIGF